jgi:hypothetical protein
MLDLWFNNMKFNSKPLVKLQTQCEYTEFERLCKLPITINGGKGYYSLHYFLLDILESLLPNFDYAYT